MPLITDAVRAQAQAALDSLMAAEELGGLGKHCTLLMPPKRRRCPDCVWDAQNRRSANRYNGTGPQPFPPGGLCPVCNGRGSIDTPVTQDIVLLCNWEPRSWVKLAGVNPQEVNVEVPGGRLQTKGFLTDLPRIMQSRRMVVETPVEGIQRYEYVLDGLPLDTGNIIQGRYVVAMWKADGA